MRVTLFSAVEGLPAGEYQIGSWDNVRINERGQLCVDVRVVEPAKVPDTPLPADTGHPRYCKCEECW